MSTQAAVVHYALEPLAVELREIPIPQVGDGEVLLEVGAVSVCGSDVHQSRNTHSWPVNIPVVLGHEFCGTVAKLGHSVTDFREGDRVVSETAAEICGSCLLCRTGRYNLCPARKGFGYGVDGAMAQFVRVPARCLHHIPDSLAFDIACLAEPHVVAYQVMCVNTRIAPGDFVVVVGPGPIGLLCTRMAALSGASMLVVAGLSCDRPRLEAARRLGATHTVDIETENLEEDRSRSLPDWRRRDLRRIGCERHARARRLRLARPDGQVSKVGLVARRDPDRREPARVPEHSTAGFVQPQLPRLGARHQPAREAA